MRRPISGDRRTRTTAPYCPKGPPHLMDALIQWLHGDPVAVFFVLVLIPGLFIGALIATARAEGR